MLRAHKENEEHMADGEEMELIVVVPRRFDVLFGKSSMARGGGEGTRARFEPDTLSRCTLRNTKNREISKGGRCRKDHFTYLGIRGSLLEALTVSTSKHGTKLHIGSATLVARSPTNCCDHRLQK